MNQKELNEIRRRIKPEGCAINRIYGCYVNPAGEIVSELDESLGTMDEEEAGKFLALLKKTLSGSVGKNLMNIEFSVQQEQEGEEHHLLMGLRDSELKDPELRQQFYEHVIGQLHMEDCGYLLLMAFDSYDVPFRGTDRLDQDESETVFTYFLCCVCPVKQGKSVLGYSPEENEFHNTEARPLVAAPELGFLFPAYEDGAANIHSALFYTRQTTERHQEFLDAVFHTEVPMTAEEQKEAFQSALSESLEEECSFDVVQTVHQELRERIEQHKEADAEEPLTVTAQDIGEILQDCGVAEEKIATFQKKYEDLANAPEVHPENFIDTRHFEVSTPAAAIKVDPKQSFQLETRVIDGRRYILVPADEGTDINGLVVNILQKEQS